MVFTREIFGDRLAPDFVNFRGAGVSGNFLGIRDDKLVKVYGSKDAYSVGVQYGLALRFSVGQWRVDNEMLMESIYGVCTIIRYKGKLQSSLQFRVVRWNRTVEACSVRAGEAACRCLDYSCLLYLPLRAQLTVGGTKASTNTVRFFVLRHAAVTIVVRSPIR